MSSSQVPQQHTQKKQIMAGILYVGILFIDKFDKDLRNAKYAREIAKREREQAWQANMENRWTKHHSGAIETKMLDINKQLTHVKDKKKLLIQRALLYMMERKYNESESDLLSVLQSDKENALLYYHLGHLYDIIGKNEEAISNYTKAIEHYNENIWSSIADDTEHSVTGKLHSKVHRFKQALPDVLGVKHLREAKRSEELAIDNEFNRVITLSDIYAHRATVYFKQEQLTSAEQDFQQAISNSTSGTDCSDSSNSSYYFSIGHINFLLGDVQGAIDYYTQCIETSENNLQVYSMRSFAYSTIGDTQKAQNDKDFVLQHDPYTNYFDRFMYWLLPQSIVVEIFSFLNPMELRNVALSNRKMKELSYTPCLWPLRYTDLKNHNNLDDFRIRNQPKETAEIILYESDLNIDAVEYVARSLKKLQLSVYTEVSMDKTNEFLKQCINVERLNLHYSNRLDLSPLKNLKYLKLSRYHDENKDVLMSMLNDIGSSLISIDIADARIYSDELTIEVIMSCPNLKFFPFSYASAEVRNLLNAREITWYERTTY
jgi:tetratricopeptide (TPR) repeat protein